MIALWLSSTPVRSEHDGNPPHRYAHSIACEPQPSHVCPSDGRSHRTGQAQHPETPSYTPTARHASTYLHPVLTHLRSGHRRNVGNVRKALSLMLEHAPTSGAAFRRYRNVNGRCCQFVHRGRLSVAEVPRTRLSAWIGFEVRSPLDTLARSLRCGELLAKLFVRRRQTRDLALQAIDLADQGVVFNLCPYTWPKYKNMPGRLQSHQPLPLINYNRGVSLNGPSLLRLQLAEGSAANQQQVRLVVDYAENRKGVAPSGYLSDSQIHTVALSLRLAAIRSFNSGAPIIVLDDVVTSYDADHRKSMAAALAEEFEDFQIVLVTHDEQFFELLQDHLPEAKWAFRRITHIDPCFGPVFSDHRTPDEEIERKLDVGEPAGEEIRKSQEEWLLRTCRDFGVEVVIRPIDRPYQYDRNELATALHNFLKAKDLMPPEVSGISNPFLISLQRGVVENFASHFSDNPYRSTSGGDEKTRWNEFRYFRDSFVCPNCGRNRFKRPRDLAVPVCKTRKCEARFNFQPILSAEM